MNRTLLIFGCGGHGKVVADTAIAAGFRVLGFADDDPETRATKTLGFDTIAIGLDETTRACVDAKAELVLAIGDNRTRARVFVEARARGLRMATVVHPSAVLAPSVELGAGSVVFARATVNPDARIGENVIVNTAVSIDHDNVIGAHAHLSPGAVLGGTVSVGEGAHVGIGACVRNNTAIGAWTVIGAGAAVVRDIPDGVVAYGVPARVVRPISSPAGY